MSRRKYNANLQIHPVKLLRIGKAEFNGVNANAANIIFIKKISGMITVLIFVLTLTGCQTDKVAMNELAADGFYHYQNNDLGFSLALPKEFIYYQTQRKQSGSATDLEIFIPTSDRIYAQEVAGYAKPITVRIYNRKDWQNLPADDVNKKLVSVVNEKVDKIYAFNFWQKIPNDWQSKWTEEMEQNIVKSLKIE